MMNLIMLTVAFTIGLVLASAVYFVIIIALMTNAKAMNWFIKRYMAAIEKSVENFENSMKGEDA